jgi:hypothetical protein
MDPTAQVPPVFIPAILVPPPFFLSFLRLFVFAFPYPIASLKLYYAIETSAKKKEKTKKKNPLETWLYVSIR